MLKLLRRRYFIDKPLQTKYLVLTLLLLVIYTLLFVLILIFPYVVPLSANAPIEEQVKAARMLLALDQSIWPALVVVMLIMGITSIFITHKIAGPVYRFKQDLAEVFRGNLDISIRLRKKDDLKDLADSLNALIGELRVCVQTLRDDQDAISKYIQELENLPRNETGQELIDKMQARTEKINQVLNKYSKPS
jgi:methyl-accepting chemotaxis protein